MAENYPKSKLKRKKCVGVDQHHTDIFHTKTLQKSHVTSSSSSITTETGGGSVVPTVAWWKREELPASERLWLLTLKCALPHLESPHWDSVSDLPPASTEKPATPKLCQQHWFDLSEEVAPFPEPSPPPLRPSSSPDPLSLSSSCQELPMQTKRTLKTLDTVVLKALPAILQESSVHGREVGASLPGPRSAGREEKEEGGGWKEEEARKQSGLIKGQRLANQRDVSESPTALAENEKEAEDKEGEAPGNCRRDGGDAGGRLQSCPMCLVVFPAGFTQMDCDGHLAQCLSEMNVDMTW